MSFLNCLNGKVFAGRRKSGSRSKKNGRRASLSLERLEERRFMSATVIDRITSAGDLHHAWIDQYSSGTEQVFEDGNAVGPAYTQVSQLMFSPDGKHLAFLTYSAAVSYPDGDEALPWITVVEDGKTVAGVSAIGTTVSDLTFSPDGTHFAFVEQDSLTTTYTVIEDGKAVGTANAGIESLTFSPDSKHFAFVEQNCTTAGNVGTCTTSLIEDGKTVGTAVMTDATGLQLDVPSPGWELNCGIIDPVFSPDSRHFAFVENNIVISSDGNTTFTDKVIEDGKTVLTATYLTDQLTFSPNSKHFAFVERTAAGTPLGTCLYSVIEDGKTVATSNAGIWNLTFSHDGKHFAFVAENSSGGGYSYSVVEDGKTLATANDDIDDLVFSPNSKIFAFMEENNNSYSVIEDGQTVGTANAGIADLIFSPNSRHFAFVEEDNDGCYTVIENGKAVDMACVGVADLVFSADSKHFAFAEEGITLHRNRFGGKPTETHWYAVVEDGATVAGVSYADAVDYLAFTGDLLQYDGF